MIDDALRAALADGIGKLGGAVPAGAVDRLAALVQELQRWGRRVNLTALLEREEILSAHIMDSAAVRSLLHGESIIDIGTGAGFPGLPLAILEPERAFVLLDANAKKLSFVRHIIGSLQLDNARVVHARAEDYAPGDRFDTVIARALASTAQLLKLGGHLVREGGVLLALKGKHPATELADVPDSWRYSVTELAVPGLDGHARHAVALTRSGDSR